ncbi:MAG: DUF2846 domain-containing protein [Flavobacteriales bacterium]
MNKVQVSVTLAVVRTPLLMIAILLLMAVVLPGTVQAQIGADAMGTVYVLRRTGYTGFADGYSIFMDGNRICVLNNKKYSVHQVPAGEHSFSVRFNGSDPKEDGERLTINIESGRDYYLTVTQRNGLKSKVELQELGGSSGKKAMEDVTRDDNCE